MSNQLATQNSNNELQTYSNEWLDLVKNTVAKDATDLELKLFAEQCKRTGLDPISKQIYFIKDKMGKVNVMTSIDGLRLIADRSEEYEGQTKTEWCDTDGKWVDVWLKPANPAAARVGVFKKNFREPLYAVALFQEYAQWTKDYKTQEMKLNYIWGSKPSLMLAKVAEALALRRAFPNDMGGIYTQDEYMPEVMEKKPVMTIKEVLQDNKEIYPQSVINGEPVVLNKEGDELIVHDYVFTFGKHKGRTILDVGIEESKKYLKYLIEFAAKEKKPLPIYVEPFEKALKILAPDLE